MDTSSTAKSKRDFFTNATIHLFVFADQVEIISPGHLPDSLAPQQIRAGRSNRRNKVLAKHAARILPYRGLGTGIPRALDAWPRIDLMDERDENQFKAVVWRPNAEPARQTVTQRPTSTPEVLKMLKALTGESTRREIMASLGLQDEKHFRTQYQQQGIALALALIEMTQPDKPRSSKQRYRLTALGQAVLRQNPQG